MKQKLLFIPGWGGSAPAWEHQMHHLKDVAECEVLVITQEETIEKMAKRVLEEEEEEFVLCGHSLGGLVAQEVAIRAPERVKKMILVGTWRGNSSPELRQLFKVLLRRIENDELPQIIEEILPTAVHESRQDDLQLFSTMKKMFQAFPKKGFINQAKVEIACQDLSPSLKKIRCPTLVIHGRQDSLFSLEEQEAMAALIPQAVLTIIEECGHMIPLERPQAVTALVRLWLALPDKS